MKKIIVANWKENLSVKEALVFAKRLKSGKNQAIIAAPFTFLPALEKSKNIKLAAQNVSAFAGGAYTGEISAKMLKEAGCSFCLVGHSERRIYFQESDEEINKKIINLLQYDIRPILCIGENKAQREKGLANNILEKQLLLGLKNIKDVSKILVAYEPVWAISTFQKSGVKYSAKDTDIIAAHSFIRNFLAKKFGAKARAVEILYGGTVNPQNSKNILKLNEVAGALVGGASLKVSDFNAILKNN